MIAPDTRCPERFHANEGAAVKHNKAHNQPMYRIIRTLYLDARPQLPTIGGINISKRVTEEVD